MLSLSYHNSKDQFYDSVVAREYVDSYVQGVFKSVIKGIIMFIIQSDSVILYSGQCMLAFLECLISWP